MRRSLALACAENYPTALNRLSASTSTNTDLVHRTMKTILLTSLSLGIALSGFAGERVSKTIEHCTKVDAGPISKEYCRVTDLGTKETVRTEKVCTKNEIGAKVSLGPVSAGASTGGGVCTTTTTPERMGRMQR
jgi:uroporphyrinogen-III synthase